MPDGITPTDWNCLACGESRFSGFVTAREMRFGTRRAYRYGVCSNCSSLTIEPTSNATNADYSTDYYSLRSLGFMHIISHVLTSKPSFDSRAPLRRFLARIDMVDAGLDSVGQLNLPKETRVLDVGCGQGQLLRKLRAIGFTNLWGIDPYAVPYEAQGVSIRRGNLRSVRPDLRFGLIMFHHSLEHVPAPLDELSFAAERLEDHGMIFVRLPLKDAFFEECRENWIGIDAPRHYMIPTKDGLSLLLKRGRFNIIESQVTASAQNLFLSKLSMKGIASNDLIDEPFQYVFHHLFSRAFRECSLRSRYLAGIGQGDEIRITARPVSAG